MYVILPPNPAPTKMFLRMPITLRPAARNTQYSGQTVPHPLSRASRILTLRIGCRMASPPAPPSASRQAGTLSQ